LSRAKPKLYSQMLCLLHRLASQPASSVPLLEYLAPKNVDLLPQLRTVLAQALPDSSQPLECSAALHQLSWLLRLQALLLLRLEHQPSMQSLLADLLTDGLAAASSSGSSPAPAALLAPLGRCVLLHTLSSIASVTPTEALLGAIPTEQRRLQSDMTAGDVSIEALLAALGVHMSNDTGDVLFNMAALYPLLMQRYEQYVARSGPGSSSDAAVAAVRSALQYVQQYNAHALVSGAQQAAAEAWVQLAEVAFTRCYAQLAPALPDADPLTKLYEVLTYSLQASSQLLATQAAGGQSSSPATSLPPLLVNAARILLSKLQEQAAVSVPLGMAADPLALVRVPTRSLHIAAPPGSTSGSNRIALIARASRVASLRVALARYLRNTVAHLDEATCAEKLADYAPGSAALAQRGLAALPADDSGMEGAGSRLDLGSEADLAFFVTRLQETCLKAEEVVQQAAQLQEQAASVAGAQPERLEGVEVLVRTLKSYCVGSK
ncbi:uncharacterized protein HaLaN_16464, partial [Haematococcus lacustris]